MKQPDPLAALTFDPVASAGPGAAAPGAGPQHDTAADEAAKQEAQLLSMLEAATRHLVTGGIAALRDKIAQTLPEIRQTWTDDDMAQPGAALVLVLRRYAGQVMAIIGPYPELVALVFSCVPLGIGYATARSKHAKTVDMLAAGESGAG